MTEANGAKPGGGGAEKAALLARWLLGGCFIYMGLSKAVLHDPADFLRAIEQYGVISNTLVLNSIGVALPWFEVYCGLLLVSGVAVRGTALVVLAMLIPFTLLVLRRALAISAAEHLAFCATKFDCGCGTGVVPACLKLVENCAFIALALALTISSSRKYCLRFALLKQREEGAAGALQAGSAA